MATLFALELHMWQNTQPTIKPYVTDITDYNVKYTIHIHIVILAIHKDSRS